ncbi:uncharacterized protein LOC136092057 [Hydra vulgaris]|uniref:Uncharacterized protein LOC136092057 n=1 Tax=Hydra vulgaris TaxID=6087 RepID=A0ABM4DMQ6_HYDVU
MKFLEPEIYSLNFWGSMSIISDDLNETSSSKTRGRSSILNVEKEFFYGAINCTQSAMFSKYKHHHTAKGLIGIVPSGATTFVSNLYAGRSSDKQITNHCGILKLCLMADRGCIINDLPKGKSLNIPPFLESDFQLTLEKELETRRVASVRIHVECAIARIKNYKILQNTFPLSMAADTNKI